MELGQRLKLIQEVGEEILTEDELLALLKEKERFVAYDGFEPSGRIHIAQGLLRAANVNRMIKAGANFKMLVADWHALANNKLGGDMSQIRIAGEYMIEVWKACGMDMNHVEFVWANDLVNNREYWQLVLQIARITTIKRITRTGQIMGRKESDVQSAAQILYPCMQAADIFMLGVDVTQLGMDQRKVNVLAREIAASLGKRKPVVVSHHMLMGLGKPPEKGANSDDRAIEMKMSKSNPESAIFMTDSKETVSKKMSKAYCPANQSAENPVMEYMKFIIFPAQKNITIERKEEYGGNLSFHDYESLAAQYDEGKIHPSDLKTCAAKNLNIMLEPIRAHFETNAHAKKLSEQIEKFTITR